MRRRLAVSWRNSALALLCCAGAARAQDAPLENLARAYPEAVARIDGNAIVFRDGTRMNAGISDPSKPLAVLLRDATIRDQFRFDYPAGAAILAPPKDFDPGRFRNQAFFTKLYGDCRRTKIDLVPVRWTGGGTVMFARANGAAEHLREVAADLEKLPADIRRAADRIAGTYDCRGVADTGRLSMHAYGAAIDLDLRYSDYWLWEKGGWRNRMPKDIVDAFERHGFIWGGRWYHYDTMHFEYRPELLAGDSRPR